MIPDESGSAIFMSQPGVGEEAIPKLRLRLPPGAVQYEILECYWCHAGADMLIASVNDAFRRKSCSGLYLGFLGSSFFAHAEWCLP